jgi:hypothetical protein
MLKVHIKRMGFAFATVGCLALAACPGQLSTDDPCRWIKPDKDHPLCPQWQNDAGSDDIASGTDAGFFPDTSPSDLNGGADGVQGDILQDTLVPADTAAVEDTGGWDSDSMEDTGLDAGVSDVASMEDVAQDIESDVQVEVCESFAMSIQPLFDTDCVICHKGPNGSFGLFLTDDVAISALVDKASAYDASLPLVTAFEPEASFLINKLQDGPTHGTKMPLGKAAWTADQVQLVSDWILAGATDEPFNCGPADEP